MKRALKKVAVLSRTTWTTPPGYLSYNRHIPSNGILIAFAHRPYDDGQKENASMNALTRKDFVAGVAVAGAAIASGCSTPSQNASSGSTSVEGLGNDARSIIAARKLSATDVTAALRTFVPSARFDDYYMFASGGHSGQVVVIGIPSMRILKIIPVFTPDAYGGWGYSTESKGVLAAGGVGDRTILHGDTHHP
ncbi:MAG TPA: hypothetical protein VFU90_08595, partial [Candidatus Tumulicola sp.]|nr:hypothetical protein [Candidatus Tumulicola sp.]